MSLTPREAVHHIASLSAACDYFRYASIHSKTDDELVANMADWWAAEKAAQMLADEAAREERTDLE